MPARFASIRAKIVVIMAVAGVAGLIGTFILVSAVEAGAARAQVHSRVVATAQAFSTLLAAGATQGEIRSAGFVMHQQQITIREPNRPPMVLGAHVPAAGAISVTSRVGGATVEVSQSPLPTTDVSLELTALAAGVLSLMLGAGVMVGGAMHKALTGPVEAAVRVADRVAHGDLSARMGDVGTPELARLAAAFDSMAARLEEADQLQKRFLSDLGHEIATPLNAVTGFALGLAEGSITSEDDKAEAAELVSAESQRLHDLLGALRRLHQLDLAQPVEHVMFDPAGVLDDICHRLEPRARAAGLRLQCRAQSTVAVGDPRLVDMAVENLVLNAVRYTPSGGRIDVSLLIRGEETEIRVRDTGIGIASEHLQRIFDRLYRVDEARARATGGFGIGLALVQRAALALGGRVEVESEKGKGSEFRLIIPRPSGASMELSEALDAAE